MELNDLSFIHGRSYTALNYSESMANSRLVGHTPVHEKAPALWQLARVSRVPEAENPTLRFWLARCTTFWGHGPHSKITGLKEV